MDVIAVATNRNSFCSFVLLDRFSKHLIIALKTVLYGVPLVMTQSSPSILSILT